MYFRMFVSRVIILCLMILFALDTFSQIKVKGKSLAKRIKANESFYYDSEREKYFSNGKSTFTIRPFKKDKEYLERIEVSIDGQDFKTYDGSLNFSSEGPHQIKFRAVDPVLNWSPIQTFRVYVDKTEPVGQYVWKGPTFSKGGDLFINSKSELSIVAQDNLSGIKNIFYKLDEKEAFRKFPYSKVFKKEGRYNLTTYAVDNVGNKENDKKLSFTVDEKSPKTKAKIIGNSYEKGDKLFANTGSLIALESSDNLSGVERVEFQLNKGLITNYSTPILLSDTKTKLHYRGIDNVNNKENWKTYNVLLDTKPPRIRMSSKGKSLNMGGKIYSRPNLRFDFRIYDKESGIQEILYSYDSKKYEKADKKSFDFSKEGEFKFHLKVKDNVGNDEESEPYNVVIDNKPPTVNLKSTGKMVNKEGVLLSGVPNRLYFDAKDEGVGMGYVLYRVDKGKYKEMKAPLELSEWRPGLHQLEFKAVDRLGNTSDTQKVAINVRTVGPNVDLFVENEDLPNVPLSEIRRLSPRRKAGSNGDGSDL